MFIKSAYICEPITMQEYFTTSFGMHILEWSNHGHSGENFLNYKWTLFNPTQIIFIHLKHLYLWKATNCLVIFNNFEENRFEWIIGYSRTRKKKEIDLLIKTGAKCEQKLVFVLLWVFYNYILYLSRNKRAFLHLASLIQSMTKKGTKHHCSIPL